MACDLLQGLNVSADIGQIDSAAGLTAFHSRQVDSELARDFANRGRRRRWRAAVRLEMIIVRGNRLLRRRSSFRRRPGPGGGALSRFCRARRLHAATFNRDQQLAYADLHALLYVNFRDDTGARRGNRADGLLGLELHDGLVFFNFLAFCNQDSNDSAALYTFSELGKFDVHEEIRGALRG